MNIYLIIYLISALVVVLFSPFNVKKAKTNGEFINFLVGTCYFAVFPIINTVFAICIILIGVSSSAWWQAPVWWKK